MSQRERPAHVGVMSAISAAHGNRGDGRTIVRETDGRFAEHGRGEATTVTLIDAGHDAAAEADLGEALTREAVNVADLLVARRQGEGAFASTDRPEDVEFELRQVASHVDEETFYEKFDSIAKTAEVLSVMERAVEDPTETAVYDEHAREVGIEAEDCRDEEGRTSAEAYAETVRQAWDDRLRASVAGLVAIEVEARETFDEADDGYRYAATA